MDGQSEEGDLRSARVRLAARLIVEEGLEGESTDALGREYYARGAAAGRLHQGRTGAGSAGHDKFGASAGRCSKKGRYSIASIAWLASSTRCCPPSSCSGTSPGSCGRKAASDPI